MEGLLVVGETAGESIAMDAEFGGGAGEVMAMAFDNEEDEAFFELPDGLFEEDSAGDHLVDEVVEFGVHIHIMKRWRRHERG